MDSSNNKYTIIKIFKCNFGKKCILAIFSSGLFIALYSCGCLCKYQTSRAFVSNANELTLIRSLHCQLDLRNYDANSRKFERFSIKTYVGTYIDILIGLREVNWQPSQYPTCTADVNLVKRDKYKTINVHVFSSIFEGGRRPKIIQCCHRI